MRDPFPRGTVVRILYKMAISQFLLLLCSLSAASSFKGIRSAEEEELMLLKRRQLECLAEIRVDPDLVFKIKRGQWMTNPPTLLKEWTLCGLMKAGLMTKEGVYRIDVALEKVREYDSKEVEAQIDACLSTKRLPAIDIAYNFVECYARSGSKFRLASIM